MSTRRLHPRRNGVDCRIAWDVLSRELLSARSRKPVWPVLRAELRSLANCDIPYFSARSDSRALELGADGQIANYFERPSFENVLTRVRALSSDQLDRQVQLIRSAFHARVATGGHGTIIDRPADVESGGIHPGT